MTSLTLEQAMPAIIGALDYAGTMRSTGELTFESADIYSAAVKVGYTDRITIMDLRRAMVAIGARPAPNGHRGRRYYIPGATDRKAAVDAALLSVSRLVKEH